MLRLERLEDRSNPSLILDGPVILLPDGFDPPPAPGVEVAPMPRPVPPVPPVPPGFELPGERD